MAKKKAAGVSGGMPVVIEILIAMAAVSCSSPSIPVVRPRPAERSPRASATPANSADRAVQSVTSSAALRCRNFVDHDPPPAAWQNVLGVVALPTSSKTAALQTIGGSNEPDPALRLYAKTGLAIRTGTTFELVVPDEAKDLVSIGWDRNGPIQPSRRVTVSCPASTSPSHWQWLGYPGGYWVPRPACVPLIVRTRGKEQRVHIGLGTPCPGQLPPQGPSDR